MLGMGSGLGIALDPGLGSTLGFLALGAMSLFFVLLQSRIFCRAPDQDFLSDPRPQKAAQSSGRGVKLNFANMRYMRVVNILGLHLKGHWFNSQH